MALGGRELRTAPLTTRPDFATPPIAEMVLSVGFAALPLRVIHLGRLWEAFRNDFPVFEEKAPYQMPLESFTQRQNRAISFELTQGVPLPRLWFIDSVGSHLVQVQADWLARNWRKVPGAPPYPSYAQLSDAFVAAFEQFRGWLRAEELPDPSVTQCEVTYIDHIEIPEGIDPGHLGSVLQLEMAGLDHPEGQQLATSWLVNHNDEPVGRLHVQANTANRRTDGRPIVVLNLTARGVPLGKGLAGVIAFHDLGREWAWKAFTALTRAELQDQWRYGR